MLVPFFAASLLALTSPTRQGASPAPDAPTDCIRYFALEEIKPEAFRKALADLPARIVTGPSTATCRPKLSFVAIEVHDSLGVKDIARGLKKGCKSVEELVWTTFRGVDKQLPSIMSVSPQDCVIGMASDMRWFETTGDAKHFYFVPGKLDADSIAKQFQNLFQPFNAGDIGTLASQTLTIALASDADMDAVKRATKAIGKLDGVRKVEIVAGSLVVRAECDGLHASAPSTEHKSGGPWFYSKPVMDALAKEKLASAK